MLKHVAPILATASIPDPDHRDFLPPEGRTLPWTPYWAGLLARQEIVVTDPPAEIAAEDAAEAVLPTEHDAGPPPENHDGHAPHA